MQFIQMTMITLFFAIGLACPGQAADKPGNGVSKAICDLNIQQALEAVEDEDPATRGIGLQRLEACTEADLPALTLAAKSSEVAIRGRAQALIEKLRRGEAAIVLQWTNGTPAAGLTVAVKLLRHTAAAVTNAETVRDRDGKNRCESTSTVIVEAQFTADAAGKLTLGRFADGDYQLLVYTTAEVPLQNFVRDLPLKYGAKPLVLTIRKGTTYQVKVVDEAGKPVPDATVGGLSLSPDCIDIRQRPVVQAQALLRQYNGGETDEKGQTTVIVAAPVTGVGVALPGYQVAVATPPSVEDGKSCVVTVTVKALVGSVAATNQPTATDAKEPNRRGPILCGPAEAVAVTREICPPASTVAPSPATAGGTGQ